MRKPTIPVFLWLLRFAILASATLLCLCTRVQAQRTLRIPADVPTIQAAIDSASSGDILLVAPGTYFENLDLRGKAVTLRSAEGPSVTILDGRNLAPVVAFTTHETRATTLSGFTLRNGAPASSGLHGGGILLVSSAPTLTGNIFTQNLCAALDGTDASPLVVDNVITQTLASARCAAQPVAPAVFTGGSPELRHNLVEHNDLSGANAASAGLVLFDATATLESNILRFNTVSNDAPSALSITGATSSITQNLIVANASHCGPAVSIDAPPRSSTTPSPTISRAQTARNPAPPPSSPSPHPRPSSRTTSSPHPRVIPRSPA